MEIFLKYFSFRDQCGRVGSTNGHPRPLSQGKLVFRRATRPC